MEALSNKRIVVGVSGGIAAYKAPELVRRLREHGAVVRVVMTENAKQFIAPLTLQAVSGLPVHHEWLDAESESGMGHIDLARWAEHIVIAPATANILAKLAHGFADDLLSTLCLATEADISVAPAMNQQMWQAPATQDNLKILEQRGVNVLGPGQGDQACGETGPGRMLEPEEIYRALGDSLTTGPWSGRKVVITAGPTWEAIDPVRGITNHSSGKMGYAVARAAAAAGAEVVLVSGPVALTPPGGVALTAVTSALEMHDATLSACEHADIFIGVAAVADYRPAAAAEQKIKKSKDQMNIALVRNPDILTAVAALPDGPYVVGFAAETERVEQHAREKLLNKGADLIAANDVSEGAAFGRDQNALILVDRQGSQNLPAASKDELSRQLIKAIDERLHSVRPSQDPRQAHR